VRGAQVRRDGWTPVHYAAAGPSVVLLSYLIDRGGDVNAVSPNGSTPLMLAARDGGEDNVKLLLRRGADKRARNPAGQTAADLARATGRDYLLPTLQ
jgi:ankyrin repeat protein